MLNKITTHAHIHTLHFLLAAFLFVRLYVASSGPTKTPGRFISVSLHYTCGKLGGYATLAHGTSETFFSLAPLTKHGLTGSVFKYVSRKESCCCACRCMCTSVCGCVRCTPKTNKSAPSYRSSEYSFGHCPTPHAMARHAYAY